MDENGRGETEFKFCSLSLMFEAFDVAADKYGGVLHKFDLREAKKETKRRNKPENHLYTGTVIYTKEDVR